MCVGGVVTVGVRPVPRCCERCCAAVYPPPSVA